MGVFVDIIRQFSMYKKRWFPTFLRATCPYVWSPRWVSAETKVAAPRWCANPCGWRWDGGAELDGQWKNPWLFYGYVGDEILPGDVGIVYPVINQPRFKGKSETKQIMVFRIMHVKESLLSTNGQSLVSGLPILQEVARDLNSHGQEYALNKTLLRFWNPFGCLWFLKRTSR